MATPPSAGAAGAPVALRFATIVEDELSGASSTEAFWRIVSPRWEGLLRSPLCWELPARWHQFWRLWTAVHSACPWAFAARANFRPLRAALNSSEGPGGEPPLPLRALLGATVMFRMVCHHVSVGGAVWIRGCPSPVGLSLWRSLMPDASFRRLSGRFGDIFVASHVLVAALVWRRFIAPGAASACVGDAIAFRPSLVYRSSAAGCRW